MMYFEDLQDLGMFIEWLKYVGYQRENGPLYVESNLYVSHLRNSSLAESDVKQNNLGVPAMDALL